MVVDIRPFDGNLASATELTDYHQLMLASAPDWANNAPTDYDSVIKRLRSGESPFGPITNWGAALDGKLIGNAEVSLPQEASTHLAVLRITVHPEYRGRGVATALLRHVAGECRALGRSAAEVWNLPVGGVGERWARQRGFVTVSTRVSQKLAVRDVDPVNWQVDAPAGYHAVTWSDAAPEELLVSYAQALNAIHDAPDGTAEFEFPQWTAQGVRAEEARLAASGMIQWTVAAVRDADNEVAGYTELLMRPWDADIAIVGNTAVLERHRGHRLGVFVKARMSAWLHAQAPARQWVLTMTNADNTHMIRVNERIGFRTTQTVVVLNAELDALTGRQAAQQNLEQ